MQLTDPIAGIAGDELDQEIEGLDRLEMQVDGPSKLARLWAATWPKIGAVVIGLGLWQIVVWTKWKPDYVLPGPKPVLEEFWKRLWNGDLIDSTYWTLRRGVVGYAIASTIGLSVGIVLARFKIARAAFGSFVSGLQTMPSIAWFPLSIVLFKLSDATVLFVVVLGAAPSIANGVISGADTVSPLLVRAGRVLGAKGFGLYRTVIVPASLPSLLAGFKQGWAFAWRSLLAGELLLTGTGHET
ncbi:MAG: ABC transporter permease, partial [Acidimicrobiia bacterium]